MGDRSPGRPGRPFKELAPQPDAKPHVVDFLRKLLIEFGLHQQDLIEPLGMSRNKLSDRFNGRGLKKEFVLRVVEVCTKDLDSHARRRRRATAERLWDRPSPGLDPRLSADARNTVLTATAVIARAEAGRADALQELVDKQRQLDEAEDARVLAEETLQAASALSAVLAVWVVILADEVQRRHVDRGAVAGRSPVDRDELVRVETLLHLTVRQHERVIRDKEKVSGDFDRASSVLAGLIITARHLHEEIARLRGDEPPGSHPHSPGAGAIAMVPFDATHEFTANIDQAISRAEEFSRTIGRQVQQAAGVLAGLDPQAVPGSTCQPQTPGAHHDGYLPGSFLALLTPDDHNDLLHIGRPHRTQELDGLSHRQGVVLVLSGTLLRKIRTSAGSFNVGVCNAGDIVGDAYALTGRLSNEYMAYWSNGDTVVVPHQEFARYINDRPSAVRALLASTAHTSAEQSRRTGRGARATLIRALVRLAESHSATLDGPITLAISEGTFHELVPQGRERLDALAGEGLIRTTDDDQMIIPDLRALRLRLPAADGEPPDAESEDASTNQHGQQNQQPGTAKAQTSHSPTPHTQE
ncbi:hypothetical protein LRE75_36175 [Streptomyces sp. 372A]